MYDIYWINDDDAVPASPTDAHYIGSLQMEEHKLLKKLWDRLKTNDIFLDYFSDSCIRSHEVTIVRRTISQLLHDVSMSKSELLAARKFDDMLQVAEARGAGVVGFA